MPLARVITDHKHIVQLITRSAAAAADDDDDEYKPCIYCWRSVL